MLSVLIPVYNYDVTKLVAAVYKQCSESKIDFEIICIDDKSETFAFENQKITLHNRTSFYILEKNIGRSAIRNLLAQKAKYENLLFLDADTIPVSTEFISKYIYEINENKKVVYGGILYENKKPSPQNLLRWIYGQKREALPVSERIKNPSQLALVSNLAIKKEIVSRFPFDENITQYGYEDLLFFSILKENNIGIKHIQNPVYHLNLETSAVFLAKTKTALGNLASLSNSKKITKKQSKIEASYLLLKKLRMIATFVFLFQKTALKIERNLTSQNPSLFLLDLYKLGYYCTLKTI
ncbi:glycosyltransferase family 2 protein [Flavobacterium foetidum]|uniref:glycosyltransferase family 2 protein n=1 Tax=Flavobacterium foetidum TaxID=2026681 RepID=UPI00107586FC|nr:glycosyltransferase family A protein [Flavobacterium foetidum]KAF2516506.1 glycosyltransferase family 2 protein [Flavobacterium foetidum]